MKRILSLMLILIILLSMSIPIYSAEKLPSFFKGGEVLFTQTTSHTDNKIQSLSNGVYLPGWYHWLCLREDGFDNLYKAMQKDNAELIIKYKGNFNFSASITSWGTVSGVRCSDVIEEDGYKYAIFNSVAVKNILSSYASNKDNIDGNGNLKIPNALSVDGQANGKGNTVYGLWVVSFDPTVATIDMDTTFQTIDGFGASYTWYSDWMVGLDCAEEGYDWIFEEAQFNILRFRDQHGLAGDERYEPTKGYPKYKGYYDAAVKRGIKPVVLVTSWGQYDRNLSWVEYTEKSSSGYSYYTLAKDKNGEYMYDELAKFCVKSVQYFFDAGIPVDYFSISNEIELQEFHKDEQGNARSDAGFFFGQTETKDHCAYWKAHLAVYEAFQKAFGDKAPSIIGAETMAPSPEILSGYLEPLIEENPEAFEVVAHHLYGRSYEAYDAGSVDREFSDIYKSFSDYRLWQTEWYAYDFQMLGDVILSELINENISAYLYWNGVWIEDKGACLVEIDTFYPWAKVKRNAGHYTMAHFSRYIKPGYIRVDVNEHMNSRIGAFKSPDGKQLVVVVSNNSQTDEKLNLEFGYKYKSSIVRQTVEGGETFKTLKEGYKQGMTVPAQSLTTIVLNLSDKKVEAPNPPAEETTKATDATTKANTTKATTTEATTEATTTTVTTTTEVTTTTATTTSEATTTTTEAITTEPTTTEATTTSKETTPAVTATSEELLDASEDVQVNVTDETPNETPAPSTVNAPAVALAAIIGALVIAVTVVWRLKK